MFAKVPFFNRSTQQEMICFKCDLSAGSILWGSGEDAAWVESAGVITRDVHSKSPVYYLCCSHYWFNWASCRLCTGEWEHWRLTALDICVLIFMRVWYFLLMYVCGSPLRSKLQNQITLHTSACLPVFFFKHTTYIHTLLQRCYKAPNMHLHITSTSENCNMSDHLSVFAAVQCPLKLGAAGHVWEWLV